MPASSGALQKTKGHKSQADIYKCSPPGAACLLWDVSPVNRAPLVVDVEQKLLTRVLDLFSDFSPPAADLAVFTPQTLFSDTCCAPRKQVSVPLIRTQPCGDSASSRLRNAPFVCQRAPSAPGRSGVLVGTDLTGPAGFCLPFGRAVLHSERSRLRGKPGVGGTVRRLLERWSRRGSGGSLPLFRSMDFSGILTAS